MIGQIQAHQALNLRDYQDECIQKVWNAWASGIQRPAAVLPTGAGKTVIFSGLIRQFIDVYRPSMMKAAWRTVVLVHRDELADQAIDKIRRTAPDLDVGKVKAADNDVNADVMVCSVQTLARPARLQQLLAGQAYYGNIGLVVVDECHHALAPTYRDIIKALGGFGYHQVDEGLAGSHYTGTKVVGFTATMVRGDGLGLGQVWDEVVFSRSVLWMISRGYLVDVRAQDVEGINLDLGTIKKAGGDYQARDLGRALQEAGAPKAIAQAVQENAPGRRSIVFTPDVATAHDTAGALVTAGISAAAVDGTTPRDTRTAIYAAFQSGRIRALVNCMVLTEGFDAPWADCAVIARPTKSPGLYIQMVGRVLRTFPGKKDALVMNVGGSGGSLSTLVDLEADLYLEPKPGESLADAYVRQEKRADERVPAGSLAFELKYRDVDLFKASAMNWLRTYKGVLFIPVMGRDRKGYVFLWPSVSQPGTWDVCGAPYGPGKWIRLHEGLPLGMAQAWAETEADSNSQFSVNRTATRRSGRPSQALVAKARSMRLKVDPGMPQGDFEDAINVYEASRKFDSRMKITEG